MPQHRRGFILLFFKILLHSLFPSPLDSYLLLSFGLLCVLVLFSVLVFCLMCVLFQFFH